ncbi:MAG TPA: hypothetical protein VM638_01370 [Actinomycetota bacterium]|nr:hypothetical protein [Actinomycetota bacterium]
MSREQGPETPTVEEPDRAEGGEPGGGGRLTRALLAFGNRLIAWVRRRHANRSPRTERILLVLAVLLFIVVTWLGFRTMPDVGRPVRWGVVALAAAVGVPLSTLLNAFEYRLSGKILGHRIALLEAIRVSVLASAANRLPIPGAALVRIGALRRLGSGFGKATTATAAVGIVWTGTSFATAGVLQCVAARWILGLTFLGGGLAGIGLGYALMVWRARPARAVRLTAELLLIELAAVALPTVKMLVVLQAIGFDVTVAQSAALAVSIVVAHATGFFPGGLGLREVIAGAMSPLVGLPVSVGLLGTAVTRAFSLVMSLLIAAIVLIPYLRGKKASAAAEAVGPPVPHDD